MQGLVEKLELNMWDGFHETIIELITESFKRNPEDDRSILIMGLPLYMLSMTGNVDVKLDSKVIEEMLKLP